MPFGKSKSSQLGQRQNPSGLTLTGLLIALSFVAMITPLALFHAAQLTAALRLRTAMLVTSCAVLAIFLAGLIVQMPPLASGGMMGLLWLPIFAIVLWQRQRLCGPLLSFILLSFPVFILLASVFWFPSAAQLQDAFQTLASLPSGDGAWKDAMGRLQQQTSGLSEVFSFAALEPWQRLTWLVFGDGLSWSLMALGVAFANLVFLDMAFDQVERLRAIALFMIQKPGVFPEPLVLSLRGFVEGYAPRRLNLEAVAVRRLPESEDGGGLLSILLRPRPRPNRLVFWGFEFEFASLGPSWNFRNFLLPLPLLLVALVILGGLLVAFGTAPAVVAASSGAPWIALPAFVSLALMTVVAIQGLLVAVERLTPGFLMASVVVLFLLSAFVDANAYMVLGALGLVGILDYAYGFRGHLAKSTKAV